MRTAAICLLLATAAFAQNPENFRLEITGSMWRTKATGSVRANGLPIDLQTDLALQSRWQFFGKLTVKPARRHRLFVDGSPYRYNGLNDLTRTVEYAGRTYLVRETVASRAELTYLSAGYQYDVVSLPNGHLGFNVSGVYLEALGRLTAVNRGLSSESRHTVGLPLAGIEGRAFLLPYQRWVYVEGDLRGMALGRYGRFVQGGIRAGVGAGPVSFQVGWQILDADVHDADDTSGIVPRIAGPMIGLQLRF